jgi:hypothetical protein
MPRGLAPRPAIPGAMTQARATPIATAAVANGIANKRRQLDRSSRTRLGFTTCTAMSGSGLRIAGTTTTMARLWTDRPGSKAAIPRSVSSAAVPGSSILSFSARPPDTGTPPTTGSASLASGLGGRLPLNSLQLYIFTSRVQGDTRLTGQALSSHLQRSNGRLRFCLFALNFILYMKVGSSERRKRVIS